MHRIWAATKVGNIAGQKALERAGFTPRGRAVLHRLAGRRLARQRHLRPDVHRPLAPDGVGDVADGFAGCRRRNVHALQVDLAGRARPGQSSRADPVRDRVIGGQDLRVFELRTGDRGIGLPVRGLARMAIPDGTASGRATGAQTSTGPSLSSFTSP